MRAHFSYGRPRETIRFIFRRDGRKHDDAVSCNSHFIMAASMKLARGPPSIMARYDDARGMFIALRRADDFPADRKTRVAIRLVDFATPCRLLPRPPRHAGITPPSAGRHFGRQGPGGGFSRAASCFLASRNLSARPRPFILRLLRHSFLRLPLPNKAAMTRITCAHNTAREELLFDGDFDCFSSIKRRA